MAPKILLPAVVGLSLCGLSAYLVYLFIKRKDDDCDITETGHWKTLEIKIPQEIVPGIIGRGGCNIKKVEEASGARIFFKDGTPDDECRICVIRGNFESIQMAELMINESIITFSQIQTVEMWVPTRACGRIIGRCGENIQQICRTSNAKVNVDSAVGGSEKRVTIKGTEEQIEIAKSLIEAKIQEDLEFRQNLAQRKPRGKIRSPVPSSSTSDSVPAEADPNEEPGLITREKLPNKGQVDGQIEVYVSAVEDPGKFWVQIVGPKANELDQLVEQMTEYYNNPINKPLHKIDNVAVGDIVAAIFKVDQKWYRAEVAKISNNSTKPDDPYLELYYVDYGDTDILNKSDVYELRTDFLRLRFQAIECFLAKVEPVAGNWSSEATDLFESLSHVAQWKKIWSKIVTYKERSAAHSNGRGRREGSPIPGVELYDNTRSGDVNVADELVKKGYAIYEKSDNGSFHREKSPNLNKDKKEESKTDEHKTKPTDNQSTKALNDTLKPIVTLKTIEKDVSEDPSNDSILSESPGESDSSANSFQTVCTPGHISSDINNIPKVKEAIPESPDNNIVDISVEDSILNLTPRTGKQRTVDDVVNTSLFYTPEVKFDNDIKPKEKSPSPTPNVNLSYSPMDVKERTPETKKEQTPEGDKHATKGKQGKNKKRTSESENVPQTSTTDNLLNKTEEPTAFHTTDNENNSHSLVETNRGDESLEIASNVIPVTDNAELNGNSGKSEAASNEFAMGDGFGINKTTNGNVDKKSAANSFINAERAVPDFMPVFKNRDEL